MNLTFEPAYPGWWCYEEEKYAGELEDVGFGMTRQEAADCYCDKKNLDYIVVEDGE